MDLASDEKVIFEGHPSWRSILRFYILGVVIAVVGGVIGAAAKSTGLGLAIYLGIAVVVLLVGWLRRLGTTYAISDQRLYIRRGLLARREQHTRVDRIQNVNTDQSLMQRVLRIGTVDFDTAGTDDADFTFHGVASPQQVVHAVDRALREAAAAAARRAGREEGEPTTPTSGQEGQPAAPASGDEPAPPTRAEPAAGGDEPA
jgi:uncharacterized membrane protein YdbT with pleckstrin-like domain